MFEGSYTNQKLSKILDNFGFIIAKRLLARANAAESCRNWTRRRGSILCHQLHSGKDLRNNFRNQVLQHTVNIRAGRPWVGIYRRRNA
jgi:hypothetical protein